MPYLQVQSTQRAFMCRGASGILELGGADVQHEHCHLPLRLPLCFNTSLLTPGQPDWRWGSTLSITVQKLHFRFLQRQQFLLDVFWLINYQLGASLCSGVFTWAGHTSIGLRGIYSSSDPPHPLGSLPAKPRYSGRGEK